MKGAPRVLGAQEFTRQLKNRILAKSDPPAADQKFNTVATSILGNRSNQVVKLVSDPTKSCSGGWTDESGCCPGPCSAAFVVADFGGVSLDEETIQISSCNPVIGCPGGILPPTSCASKNVTITLANGSGFEFATFVAIFSFLTFEFDFIGTTVEIDGVSYPVEDTNGPGGPLVIPNLLPGTLTASSVITIHSPNVIPTLDGVVIGYPPLPPP